MVNLDNLKVKELKFNIDLNLVDKVSILNECISTIGAMSAIRDAMDKCRDSLDGEYDEAIDLILDCDRLISNGLEVLPTCKKKVIGSSGSIRRRLIGFFINYEAFARVLEPYIELYIPMKEEDFEDAFTKLTAAIGQLSCYAFYQFNLKDCEIDDSDVTEVSDVVDYWLRDNSNEYGSIREVAQFLELQIQTCNPTMGVFEKYPELLEPFSNLVGSAFYDCADISAQKVMDIIDGKIDVDEFLEQLEKTEEGSND